MPRLKLRTAPQPDGRRVCPSSRTTREEKPDEGDPPCGSHPRDDGRQVGKHRPRAILWSGGSRNEDVAVWVLIVVSHAFIIDNPRKASKGNTPQPQDVFSIMAERVRLRNISVSSDERRRLADLLLAKGPDAPTLCEGGSPAIWRRTCGWSIASTRQWACSCPP